jgi:hypothetical protein
MKQGIGWYGDSTKEIEPLANRNKSLFERSTPLSRQADTRSRDRQKSSVAEVKESRKRLSLGQNVVFQRKRHPLKLLGMYEKIPYYVA